MRWSMPYIGCKVASAKTDPLPTMAVSVITEITMIVAITPAELVELKSREDVDMIDVRELAEWDAGHVPGARLVPLAQLRADPEAALVRGRAMVFICAKGVRSLAAAKLAERFGFDRLYNLDGGTKSWSAAGLPLLLDSRAAA
jgi:rhodanese-related sulfurtransferase